MAGNYILSQSDGGRVLSFSDIEEVDEIKREIRGRLLLWHQAVATTITHVHTGNRAHQAKTQENIRKEQDQYFAELNEYRKQQSDYEEKVIEGEHMRSFDANYKRPFPTFIECYWIHQACISMAAIAFCQIFNSGYRDPGKVAANTKSFRKEHWDQILELVFYDEDEKVEFNDFCERLQSIRNSMLGHADGNAYDVEHGADITRLKTMEYDVYDLDLKYWMSFLEPLRISILKYSEGTK
ncbi:MAG: hypothetical protein ABJF88_10520 [Rhodothermales bacterium]